MQKSPETLRFQDLGGDKRDRTADLLNAIQALSRLHRLHTPANRAKERFNMREFCIPTRDHYKVDTSSTNQVFSSNSNHKIT